MGVPTNEWDKDGKYHPDTQEETFTPDELGLDEDQAFPEPPTYIGPNLLAPSDHGELSPFVVFLLQQPEEAMKDVGLLLLQKGIIPESPMKGRELLPSDSALHERLLAFVAKKPTEYVWLRDSGFNYRSINCHSFCHSRAYMIVERTYEGAYASHFNSQSDQMLLYLEGKGFVKQDQMPGEDDLAVVLFWQNSKGDGVHSAWFSEFMWNGVRLWESQLGPATCRILHQHKHYVMIQHVFGESSPPFKVDFYMVLKNGLTTFSK